jgi:hypothetical protein
MSPEAEMVPPRSVDPLLSNVKATDLAAAFTTALTTIATGALVFSIGLVSNAPSFDNVARIWLIVSWFLLTVSVVSGLAAQSTIGMHILNGRSIFESPVFERPSRIQQISFFLSIVVLAVVLGRQMFTPSLAERIATKPRDAVTQLQRCVTTMTVTEISTLDWIGSAASANFLWHAKIIDRHARTVEDVFVDAETGRISDIQRPEHVRPDCRMSGRLHGP